MGRQDACAAAARLPALRRLRQAVLFVTAAVVGSAGAAGDLEADFRRFLENYVQQVEQRNASYLARVHPDLPPKLRDFFFDVTLNMMQHARGRALEPEIECKEYEVCNVIWPQPGGSWAAQSFIRHEGVWRFLVD